MHLKTTSLCAYTFCHYSPHRQLTSVWTLSVISYRFNPLSHACADRHLPDCEHIMGVLPLPSSLPSQGRRRSLKRRIISKAGFFFHGVAMSFVDPPSSDRARKQPRRSMFLGCSASAGALSVISYRFNPLSHACANRHLLDCQYIMGALPLLSSLPSQGRRRSLKRRISPVASSFCCWSLVTPRSVKTSA